MTYEATRGPMGAPDDRPDRADVDMCTRRAAARRRGRQVVSCPLDKSCLVHFVACSEASRGRRPELDRIAARPPPATYAENTLRQRASFGLRG
jgi:hypothetical protein